MKKKIKVIFCGGCNPNYDQKQFINKLKKKYNIKYGNSFEKDNCNLLLLVNGCARKCLKKTDFEDYYNLVIDSADFLEIFSNNNSSNKLSQRIIDHIEKI